MKIPGCEILNDLVQGSEIWFAERKGKVTASQAARILTPTGKDSSQWDDYAIELTAECIRPDELPEWTGNSHTDRGNELEPVAREKFAEIMECDVVTVGFVKNTDRYRGVVGCSPDGLVMRGSKVIAGLELKCPLAKHHAAYVIAGGAPAKYLPQVHFSMALTGLPWYFMSFCYGMAPHIVRVEADSYTAKMADAVERFVTYYGTRMPEIMPVLLGKAAA